MNRLLGWPIRTFRQLQQEPLGSAAINRLGSNRRGRFRFHCTTRSDQAGSRVENHNFARRTRFTTQDFANDNSTRCRRIDQQTIERPTSDTKILRLPSEFTQSSTSHFRHVGRAGKCYITQPVLTRHNEASLCTKSQKRTSQQRPQRRTSSSEQL